MDERPGGEKKRSFGDGPGFGAATVRTRSSKLLAALDGTVPQNDALKVRLILHFEPWISTIGDGESVLRNVSQGDPAHIQKTIGISVSGDLKKLIPLMVKSSDQGVLDAYGSQQGRTLETRFCVDLIFVKSLKHFLSAPVIFPPPQPRKTIRATSSRLRPSRPTLVHNRFVYKESLY